MDIAKNITLHKQGSNKPDHPVIKDGMPHAAVQIYLWICLTLTVQMLHGFTLMLLAAMLIILSFRVCAARFVLLLRRTRWILFSVLLIYAYTSPGDALWTQLGAISPVTTGIVDGFLQLSRLVAVLAGLSILLTLLSQPQLIAGLYTLSSPLSFFGLSRERVAVRLALTLSYAESAMQDTANNWHGSIEQLLAPLPVALGYIELPVTLFSRRDWLLVAAASAALLKVWI